MEGGFMKMICAFAMCIGPGGITDPLTPEQQHQVCVHLLTLAFAGTAHL